MKKNLIVLTIILLVGITFSVVQITRAVQDTTVDNPGHPWIQLYNFPDDCTGDMFVKGFNSVDGLKCFTPAGTGLWDGLATGNIWNANTGNVGIGTIDPKAKLDIDGAIRIDTSATRNRTTDGFACTDINTSAQLAGCTGVDDRGKIKIVNNTNCNRDSLCYCGIYDGNYRWICLVSCPE